MGIKGCEMNPKASLATTAQMTATFQASLAQVVKQAEVQGLFS